MKKSVVLRHWLFLVLLGVVILLSGCQALEQEPGNNLGDTGETADTIQPANLGTTAETVLPQGSGGSYPILFATQIPIREDFTTIGSTFGNHEPSMQQVGRGGDLYIRYPDGTLKNLTQLAGYGSSGAHGPPSSHRDLD